MLYEYDDITTVIHRRVIYFKIFSTFVNTFLSLIVNITDFFFCLMKNKNILVGLISINLLSKLNNSSSSFLKFYLETTYVEV